MESLLPWLNVVALPLLFAVCVALYLDMRGKQNARAAWEGAMEKRLDEARAGNVARFGALSLEIQTIGIRHDGEIGRLDRVVARHDGEIGTLSRTVASTVRRLDVMVPPGATTAAIEAARRPEPDVDTEGDRGGLNPGDFAGSVSVEQIQRSLDELAKMVAARPNDAPLLALQEHWQKMLLRARAEAEAEARSAARAPALPEATAPPEEEERPTFDDATKVFEAPTAAPVSLDETWRSEGVKRPPAPLPSSLAALSRARVDPDQRATLEAPPPVPVRLDAAEMTRIAARAKERGITVEAMIQELARTGDLAPPANDGEPPTPPPVSGQRRS